MGGVPGRGRMVILGQPPLHRKNSGVKLTPAGVNTGPISNGVNLTPFWCYFNTEKC